MNRFGGTYSYGDDDSSSNIASAINYDRASISSWSYGNAAWGEFMDCIRDQYARFDVEVTDVDPGAALHIETVVSGSPDQAGLDDNVGGIAPMFPDCTVVEPAIAFAFADIYGGDIRAICETAAQESAHTLGLDHEFLCSDPMTYLNDCGPKSFQDTDAPCGEYDARECRCGGNSQNSVRTLLAVLGPAGDDKVPPDLRITRPSDGAEVPAGFVVEATASDDTRVSKIDLLIDDLAIQTDTAAPWSFTAPTALAAGQHIVELQAYDERGNKRSRSISIVVEAKPECSLDSDCGAGATCTDNKCVDSDQPAAGATGAYCASENDCTSGLCADDGTSQLCTEICTTTDSCPGGFSCAASDSGDGVCWPDTRDQTGSSDSVTGGCVATTAQSQRPMRFLLTFLVAITYRSRASVRRRSRK